MASIGHTESWTIILDYITSISCTSTLSIDKKETPGYLIKFNGLGKVAALALAVELRKGAELLEQRYSKPLIDIMVDQEKDHDQRDQCACGSIKPAGWSECLNCSNPNIR